MAHAGGRPPGPTKLTPEVRETIAKLVSEGVTRRAAAASVGIHEETLYAWLRSAASGDEPFLSFSEALQKADAEAEARLTAQVLRGGRDWTSAAWWLERRRRADYGRIERMEVSGANGGPIVNAIAPITAADLAAMGATELARFYATEIGSTRALPDGIGATADPAKGRG